MGRSRRPGRRAKQGKHRPQENPSGPGEGGDPGAASATVGGGQGRGVPRPKQGPDPLPRHDHRGPKTPSAPREGAVPRDVGRTGGWVAGHSAVENDQPAVLVAQARGAAVRFGEQTAHQQIPHGFLLPAVRQAGGPQRGQAPTFRGERAPGGVAPMMFHGRDEKSGEEENGPGADGETGPGRHG